MNLLPELDIFGNIIEPKEIKLSKKEQRKIERAKLKKLGEANYFYPTTGKNVWHTDGFVNGKNGEVKSGGYTIFKNGKLHAKQNISHDNLIFTNNEAEIMGVWCALWVAEEGDEIVTDSMNTLAWVRSGKPKARPDLTVYAKAAKDLLHSKKINLYWRPREENQAGNYNEFVK